MLHLTKKYLTCWCVCFCDGTSKQLLDTFHTHAKNNINSLKTSHPQIPSKEAHASFCPSKRVHTAKQSHNVRSVTKSERTRRANSTQKGSSLTFLESPCPQGNKSSPSASERSSAGSATENGVRSVRSDESDELVGTRGQDAQSGKAPGAARATSCDQGHVARAKETGTRPTTGTWTRMESSALPAMEREVGRIFVTGCDESGGGPQGGGGGSACDGCHLQSEGRDQWEKGLAAQPVTSGQTAGLSQDSAHASGQGRIKRRGRCRRRSRSTIRAEMTSEETWRRFFRTKKNIIRVFFMQM